jgi:hypothetical protein
LRVVLNLLLLGLQQLMHLLHLLLLVLQLLPQGCKVPLVVCQLPLPGCQQLLELLVFLLLHCQRLLHLAALEGSRDQHQALLLAPVQAWGSKDSSKAAAGVGECAWVKGPTEILR